MIINPYAPPPDPSPRKPKAVKLKSAESKNQHIHQYAALYDTLPLINYLLSRHKDSSAAALNVTFEPSKLKLSDVADEERFIHINPAVERENQALSCLQSLGVHLKNTHNSPGGTLEFRIEAVDLNHPALKPPPLDDAQKNRIKEACIDVLKPIHTISAIVKQYDDKDNVRRNLNALFSLYYLDSLSEHISACMMVTMPENKRQFAKQASHIIPTIVLDSRDWERSLAALPEQDPQDPNTHPRQQALDALADLKTKYQQHEETINTGLHHYLYGKAEKAYEEQQAELPKGCLGKVAGPIKIIGNGIKRFSGHGDEHGRE